MTSPKGFALDKREPLPSKSKNQLYKQYVNSMGNKPAKSYKEWLNIVKDEYPELVKQKIDPISAIDCPTVQLNVDGEGIPKVQDQPKVEQFKLMGMSIGKLALVTALGVGAIVVIVKTVKYYKNKNAVKS